MKVPGNGKLKADTIFPDRILSQAAIDSASAVFFNLPFYEHLLYNPETKAWPTGLRINKDLMATKARVAVVASISKLADDFGKENNLTVYKSGFRLSELKLP